MDYENKRAMILTSTSHLVEIDLLRQWPPLPIQAGHLQSTYRILVSIQEQRPKADLYAFNLSDPIPSFPLPLRQNDPAPIVNLRRLLDGVYDRSGYGFVINYAQAPVPPFTEAEAAWVKEWLSSR